MLDISIMTPSLLQSQETWLPNLLQMSSEGVSLRLDFDFFIGDEEEEVATAVFAFFLAVGEEEELEEAWLEDK